MYGKSQNSKKEKKKKPVEGKKEWSCTSTIQYIFLM
jgi:hypothetical protein